jgi:hypothetical protein
MLADGNCGIPTSKEGKNFIKRFRVSYTFLLLLNSMTLIQIKFESYCNNKIVKI